MTKYTWHRHLDRVQTGDDSSEYVRKLRSLLQQVGSDPKVDCEYVVDKLRQSVHRGLQKSMQLGQDRRYTTRISVTDYLPYEISQIVEKIPDVLMWIIAFKVQIRDAAPVLNELSISREQIWEHLGIDIDADSANTTAKNLRAVQNASDARIKEILDQVIRSPMDLLGSYSPSTNCIQIYWLAIFIVSLGLGIPFDRLTYVVLTHELAHYYSHAGVDADKRNWHIDAFCAADVCVVEGLAQFWTKELCSRQDSHFGLLSSHSTLECFQELLAYQSEPYRCFQEWLPSHQRRIESVRGAMLKIREGSGKYDEFLYLLEEFGRVYAQADQLPRIP